MIAIAQKGTSSIRIADDLTAKLSRPLKKTMVVEFRSPAQHKKGEIQKRRNIQNRTCWMVSTDAAKHRGETINDTYFDFKYTHLAPVLAADCPEFAAFHEQMEASRMLIDGKFWRSIADRAYTSHDSSVQQYAKALDEFMNALAREGVNYRHPADYQAMLIDEFYQGLIE